jgi:hypothetical protein
MKIKLSSEEEKGKLLQTEVTRTCEICKYANGINFETNARLGTAADRVLPSTSLEIRVETQQQQQNSDEDNDVDDDKMTDKSLTVHRTLQSAVMTKEPVC